VKVLLLGNGPVAAAVAAAIVEHGDTVVGLVVHPPERQKALAAICEAARVAPDQAIAAQAVRTDQGQAMIRRLDADICVSAYFGYIVPPAFLRLFNAGAMNLHPGLLPFNRGAYSNVWAIVDKTPAGVTLHYMDEGIDTGDIIAQLPVEIEPVDTGQTLHAKLERAAVELFTNTWPAVSAGTVTAVKQQGEGTSHRVRDVERIDRIDLDRSYRAGDLLDILRARTFPPFGGAYIEVDGRKIQLRLDLEYE
jgi:methionyl-tRNA formyltransferase